MNLSADACRARADEAEQLARTVSYRKDRDRLQQEARSWRDRADRFERRADMTPSKPPSIFAGLIKRLVGR